MNQRRFGRARRALLHLVIAAAAIGALSGAGSVALADSSASPLPPEWHVHDGQTQLGLQHKGVGFFPTILGISKATYLLDPARCPNATDKAFLPSNGNAQSELLRAGVCFTSTQVIEIRTIRPDAESPGPGWNLLGFTDGGTWVTYYRVTSTQ
jgi:hypothetical protein